MLVNLSNHLVATNVTLEREAIRPAVGQFQMIDAWDDCAVSHASGYAWNIDDLASFDLPFEPYQVRVLLLRPAN